MAKSEWEIESETPIDTGWEIRSEDPIEKAPETGPSSLPTMTFGEDYGVQDESTAVVPPTRQTPTVFNSQRAKPGDAGFDPMVRPEFIDQFRQELGKLPVENRLAALQQYAENDNSVYGRAARVILSQEQAANERILPGNRAEARSLAGGKPATSAPGKPGAEQPAIFPEATPNFMERADGITPEQVARENELARGIEGVRTDIRQDPNTPDRVAAEANRITRREVAEDSPIVGGAASGAAGMLTGLLNVPNVTADFFNQIAINPLLELAGLNPLPRVAYTPGTDALQDMAADYMPKVAALDVKEAWDSDQFGGWLTANLAANSPQLAMSLAAAFVPPLRAVLLGGMGGMAAGISYAEGDDSRLSMGKGTVEVVSEMLPLQVFDKINDVVGKLPLPKQKAIMAVAGQKLLQSGGVITANALTNAIEETAAQFGGNVLDKYFAGKDIPLDNELFKAAIMGAAGGKVLGLPQAAMLAARPSTAEDMAARALADSLSGGEFVQPDVTDILRQESTLTGGEIRPESTSVAAKAAAIQAEQGRLEQMRATAAREQSELAILTPTIESTGSLSAATDAAIAAADQSVKVGTVLTEITNQASQNEQLAATLSALESAAVISADAGTALTAQPVAQGVEGADTRPGLVSTVPTVVDGQSEPSVALTFATFEEAQQAAVRQSVADQVEVVDTGSGFTLAPKTNEPTIRQLRDDAAAVEALNRALPPQSAVARAAGGWADLRSWALEPGRPVGQGAEGARPEEVRGSDGGAEAQTAARVAEVVKQAFGLNLVPVTGLGAYGVTYGDRAFVDVESVGSGQKTPAITLAVATMGHESGHLLQASRDPAEQAAYKNLQTVVKQYLRDGVLSARQKSELDEATKAGNANLSLYGSEEYAVNEIVNDLNGAMWLDPKFWDRLYQIDDGSTFRRVLYRFMQAATKFVEVAKGSRLDPNTFVTNVEAVREAAAQAWATRARGKDAPPEITNPQFSRNNPLIDTVNEQEAAARIRRREGRRDGVGQPGNERMVFGEGDRMLVVGKVTIDDWIAKAQRMLPGQQMEDARRWYQQLHDFLSPIYGEDAERYALAWLLSQQRASPSKGMMDVLRAVDLVNGKPRIVRLVDGEMKELRAGLNEDGLIQALTGIYTGNGVGSKLMDFVDSEMGKTVRTVVRDDPRGRQPAAIDVWAFRDIGFVDETVLNYIRKTFGDEAAAAVKQDASMGEPQYEYGIDFYNDTAEELNRRNFMGGGWTAAQIQAVGWVSTQASMGVQAEFVRDIVGANTRRVSIGLAPGEGTPMADTLMGREIPVAAAQKVIAELAERAGVKIIGNASGVGAYLQYVEGSIQLETFASPEAVRDFMDMLGYALQQTEVVAARQMLSGNRSAIDIMGDDFGDAGQARLWFDAFLRAQGKKVLAPGFQQVQINGQNGVRLINFDGRWQGARLEKILDAVDAAAAEVGIRIAGYRDFNINLESTKHDWTKDQTGAEFLGSLTSRGRVRDVQWLASRYPVSRKDFLSFSRTGLEQPAGGSGSVVEAGDRASVRGAIHFGRQRGLSFLSGAASGTGIKGAEQERLRTATDPRIKKRVYFYLPTGGGTVPQPEIGLGVHVYSADLEGLYDPATASRPIRGDGNALESAVLDAGYKGYISREQGTIVVLNSDVPVRYEGTADQFQKVKRTPQVAQPKQLTRREGEELVRRPSGDELREIIRLRADITFAAPSFRLQFGEARVAVGDAPVADQVLADGGAKFRFGEPQFSRMIDSPDEIDDLGAFNLDAYDFDESEALQTEPSLRDLVAELEDSGYTVAGRAGGADQQAQENFALVSDKDVRRFGLTPENAFVAPPMTENEYGNFEVFVMAGGARRRLEVQPFGDGWASAMAGLRIEADWGRPLGLRNVSFDIAQNHVRRVAAAAELFARKYDFYKTIPKKSAERIAAFWSAVPEMEGATEFTPGEPEVEGSSLNKLRMVATARLAGSGMRPSISYHGGHLIIDIVDEDGEVGSGSIELLGKPRGQDRQTVAFHTTGMTKGSGMGKAFYSIANSYAKIMGLKVVADAEGLTAVNSVRRTENAMSSAARTGGESLIEPGWSQRVYGFNPKAKTDAQKQQNLVRLAMAQARNVYELAPEAEGITYNLEAERFERAGREAEAEVASILRKPEVRAFSLGRTSFIRAALTRQLIDEDVALPASVEQPLLYSRRSGPEQFWIGKELAVPEHPAYAEVEDGTLAVMPQMQIAGRSFAAMPIKMAVGDNRSDGDAGSKDYGLQHVVSNKLLKNREFVASTGDIAEDAARDIAATALSAMAAYGDFSGRLPRVIFASALTKRVLVTEVRREGGGQHYSVVTLMPLSAREQQKYGAPTLVRSGTVQTPLSGRLSTQGGLDRLPLTAPTTQQGGPTAFVPLTSAQLAQELLKTGATPSRGLATYIINDKGQVSRAPSRQTVADATTENPNWPSKKVFPGLKAGVHEGGGVYRLKDGSARYLDQDGNVVDAPAFSRKDVSPVGFYSALARSVEEAKVSAAPAAGWKDLLKGMLNKGQVKADEIEWTGINDWLDLQTGKVTKQQIADYLNANGVQVEEVVLGNPSMTDRQRLAIEYDRAIAASEAVGGAMNPVYIEGLDPDQRKPEEQALLDAWNRVNENPYEVAVQPSGGPKYGQYTLPGGENYREVLLTLPTTLSGIESARLEELNRLIDEKTGPESGYGALPDDERRAIRVEVKPLRDERTQIERKKIDYKSKHWNQPNVLAHIRLNDRTDADGNRVLFVEEIQSDWGQEGKKKGFARTKNDLTENVERRITEVQIELNRLRREGVRTPPDGALLSDVDPRFIRMQELLAESDELERARLQSGLVPTAPFVTKTEGWLNLALKRVMVMAAEGGYDKVAFTTGAQNADRYDLSKQISKVRYEDNTSGGVGRANMDGDPGSGFFYAYGPDGNLQIDRRIEDPAKELPELVGKELAERLLNAQPEEARKYGTGVRRRELSGVDLKVGGEGMKAFYDKIVPNAVSGLLKKLGGGQLAKVDLARQADGFSAAQLEELSTSDLTKLGVDGVLLMSQPGFAVTDAMREKVANGVPLFSRNPLNNFKLDPENGWLKTQRMMQDYFSRVDQVQQAIAGQGGVVNERNDTYRAEERSYGRIHEAIKDFADKWVKPMVEKAARADVSMDELSLYAYALHAKERNRRVASINPAMKDGGSGMTNKEADAIIKQFNNDPRAAVIKDLHSDLMAITATTRRTLLEEGLITDEQYAALDGMYQNYVPLRGFENESDPRIQQLLEERGTRLGTGQGFSIKGNETLRALGRRTRAGDIIENIINDYERAVVRGEKNAVARTFYQFVLDNPSPNLWEIDAEKTKRSLGIDGYVKEKVVIDTDDNTTIAVKLKGNEVFIKVKDPLLARAMKKVHNNDMGEQLRTITSGLNLYTTLLRNTLTRFNPEFAIVNLVRDAGFGTMAVLDELGERGVALFWKHYAASNASAHRYEMGRLDPTGNVSDRYFTEYRMAGGTTGGFYMKDADQVRGDIRDMMLLAGAAPNNWVEKVKTFGGKAAPYRAARAAGRVLEHVGAVSENAARVAAFRAAREMGKTPAEAAKIAKNLTTNFNRKGEYGQLLNSLFVFYNAAIQGADRTVKLIKNPKVQKYLAGMVASSMAIALANAWGAGDDEDDGEAYWDKIPAHVKERNLIIMLPPADELDGAERVGTKGRYVAIPVQYGLNVFTSMGYGLADMLRHYGQDKTRGRGFLDVAGSMASVTFGSFNPFGGSVDNAHAAAMIFLPSAADVVYQLANGVNSFGTPVAPFKSELDTKPDSENVNARQAGGPAHGIARWLNSLSGGDDTAAGAVDVSPGTIENVWGNLTGGTGRFINDVLTLSMNGLEYASGGDPDIFVTKVPVFRKIYGETDGAVDSGLFYDRRRLIQEARQEQKAKDEQGRELMDSEKLALASMSSDANRYTKMISAIRREMVEIGKDEEMTVEEKRAQIRALKAERDALTRDFNRMFIETMRAEAAGDFAIPE